jgi:inhibitor of KinA sporulation pathway (predicted exonuclease)
MCDECWIDCQEIFADRMDSDRCFSLSEALVLANIDYDEGAHDALVDARNTALLFEKVECAEEFTLSPYFIRSDTADSYTFNPFKRVQGVGAC